MGGPRTSAATIDILQRYVLSTGGVPLVLKKEYPGYVLNAMLGPLLGCALLLVADGVASPEDVDRAWMGGRGATMGPFGMMDLFGVNVIHDSWQYRREDPFTARLRPKILALLQPMIDKGELGMKSGRGFYQYPAPQYQQSDFLCTGSQARTGLQCAAGGADRQRRTGGGRRCGRAGGYRPRLEDRNLPGYRPLRYSRAAGRYANSCKSWRGKWPLAASTATGLNALPITCAATRQQLEKV